MCRSIALPLIVKTRVIESAGPRDVHLAVTGEARRYYFPGISVKAFLPLFELPVQLMVWLTQFLAHCWRLGSTR